MSSIDPLRGSDIMSLPARTRINDQALVAVLIDGADAEKVVVLGHFPGGISHCIAHEYGIRPVWRGRIAPDDLISGEVCVLACIPFQIGVIGKGPVRIVTFLG